MHEPSWPHVRQISIKHLQATLNDLHEQYINETQNRLIINASATDTAECLSFHPMAQCVVHALKGLACRARVTPASSPASHCKQCSALHARGCASPSRAYLGSQKQKMFQWVQDLGTQRYKCAGTYFEFFLARLFESITDSFIIQTLCRDRSGCVSNDLRGRFRTLE